MRLVKADSVFTLLSGMSWFPSHDSNSEVHLGSVKSVGVNKIGWYVGVRGIRPL